MSSNRADCQVQKNGFASQSPLLIETQALIQTSRTDTEMRGTGAPPRAAPLAANSRVPWIQNSDG